MAREIKFRAWFIEMKVMLESPAVYPSGMIGMSLDDFVSQLPEKLEVSDGKITIELSEDGESGGDLIGSYLEGDEWIWLEKKQYNLLQYTGFTDKDGKEIYEGDIVLYVYKKRAQFRETTASIEWRHTGFCLSNNETIFNDHFAVQYLYKGGCVIGNIYENPELLKSK